MLKLYRFLKREFPKRKIIYRNEEFLFLADLPVKYMEEMTNLNLKGLEQVKYLLRVFSYKPKLTERRLDALPATMLIELYNILFPKKEQPISPNMTTMSDSSPASSTNPTVKSETGDITK